MATVENAGWTGGGVEAAGRAGRDGQGCKPAGVVVGAKPLAEPGS